MRPIVGCCLITLLLGVAALGQAPARQPILLDTDLGTDVDDAFALALLLASPEVDLRGVTTVGDPARTRAMMLCRFLTMTGRRQLPVAVGDGKQPSRPISGQYQYYYHPDVLFNRTTKPVKEGAADFLFARLQAQPGQVTILATGPLTNVAKLLADRPKAKSLVRRVVVAGGSANGKAEANFAADGKAAQAVLASGVPLVVVPFDVTAGVKLGAAERKRIFGPATALSLQTQALYQLTEGGDPNLASVLAAALCVDDRFVTMKEMSLEVDAKGRSRQGNGKANARVVTEVKEAAFLRWYVDRMAACVPPGRVPVKPVVDEDLPHRVHVAEDYETDIERRWWMAGKAETRNVPPGSTRACRGVLTHDFDDLLGNAKAMETAVIFNPVPGPPMGKNTRLRFRCWLGGADELRVQIYSLTNGYHRHLVLKGLPQNRWQTLAVDMTKARRPDGTGGPLSEGERIDDIQFYASPKAELIIDDIVLYDAAGAGEKRPFPARVHFAGTFDTGRQVQEWPGAFAIARDRGAFWHAARSVENPESKAPWIKVGLRGERPLGANTALSFRYHLTGAERVSVRLVNSRTKRSIPVGLKGLEKGKWGEAAVDFGQVKRGEKVDEVHFLVEKGAELLVDDLLLYDAPKR